MSPSSPADVADAVSPEPAQAPDATTTGEVVVGVDGSRTALEAVRWAAREAAAREVPLRLVHAATYLGEADSPGGTPPELPRARSILATAFTAARHAVPGLRVETELVTDPPETALLHAGDSAGLLVLGISTTGVADELVLASLCQHVAVQASRPVVVVPRQTRRHPAGRPVVAILGPDAPADDAAVVPFAADAARRMGRPLSLLDVRDDETPDNGWRETLGDLEVQRTAVPGASAVTILEEMCPTPLLVLATGHSAPFRRLDRLHRWLLRHCTSPMALVPASAG
jgi:nucleotide-binding universal stress UspA family protein